VPASIAAPKLSAGAKNQAIAAAENKIAQARDAVTAAKAALKPIPAKLPASQVTPGAQKAILRTRRRSLQMVLRLLATAAGHWLGNQLNDYLRDPDEYRAVTRHLLHLGGTITSTPPRHHRDPRPPGRAPHRPRPRPAPRPDQRRAAPHARRHPAHHLPARGPRARRLGPRAAAGSA
jgi:hypothetical protein